ncbi:MAG: VWA domain-containing protein [Bradymonadaceae bacterium]|nr:VWA domain-containing protein [Lujinxingiaceae bacterium]
MSAFDAQKLDKSYAFLEVLSDELLAVMLDQTTGTLNERTSAIEVLRGHLLKGAVPDAAAMPWPSTELLEPIFGFLEDLKIAPLCEGQPELVEELIKSLLTAIRDFERSGDVECAKRFLELRADEEERRREEQAALLEAEESLASEPPEPLELPEDLLAELRERALAEAKGASQAALIGELEDEWGERVAMWWQVFDVFGQLAGILGQGWSYARGLVRSQSWLQLVELRKLMERLPQLQELIATLGRMHISDDDTPPVMETIFASMRRTEVRYEDVLTPLAPMETRGVRRSNDISRLLPAEALNFAHPRLRTLFYARMHEHALATYLVEGVMPQRIENEHDVEDELERPAERPPKNRGPIIACLDTSGSMAGTPEHVAKALVLEALRVAQQESRPCYVIAFSGPGQTEAQELSLSPEGFQSLFAFLGRSFHGGTDLVAPLQKALALLGHNRWEKADILLVSDGEFPVPHQIMGALNEARDERGLKLHGVCIGHRSTAMQEICDAFHVFGEWEALRG